MVIPAARSDGAWGFPQRQPSWIIGSVPFNHDGSLASLQRCLADAEAAGCNAIKVPHYRAETFFAGVNPRAPSGVLHGMAPASVRQPRLVGLSPADLQQFVDECVDRLSLVMAVFDARALSDVMRLRSEVTMLSVEAPAATNPLLVESVAETGCPALVEVNLLTPDQIKAMCQRFASGQLTLVWRQGTRPSPTRTVEDLFALVRLQQYACPVGYAGSTGDSLAALVAVGFGATVIEEALSSGRKASYDGSVSDLAHLVSLIRRCQAAPAGLEVETLSPAELDAIDEFRPSLIAARSIARGETIMAEMLVCKAPFRGLSPNLLPLVLGKRALYDIAPDEPITFGVIDL